jgi:soluble lytic murein transglycosylase
VLKPASSIAAVAAAVVIGLVSCADVRPAAAQELSQKDERIYRDAFRAVKSRKWNYAAGLAAKAQDPLPAKTILWLRLAKSNPPAGFEARAKFIDENPEWPELGRLQRLAEESMGDAIPDETLLAWFATHEPLTGLGLMRYGEALKRAGHAAKAEGLLRRAWVEGDFTRREERTFLARHRKLLRAEDHVARLDRLLWQGRYHPARRMMRRVDKGHAALAEARLRLRRMEGGVDWAIRQVPDELKRDPGLMYERLRWRRRRGRDESAREILADLPPDLVRPEDWWDERAILARRALAAGDISIAYRLARGHGLSGGAGYAEGEWLAGWIALRFLQEHEATLQHFTKVYETARYPISRARGAYWAGRAAEARNHLALAGDWYRRAAEYVTTYHGQLAAHRLQDRRGVSLPPGPRPSRFDSQAFDRRELVKVVRQLGQIGESRQLRPFILRLQDLARTPAESVLVGNLAIEHGRPDFSIQAAKRAVRDGVILIEQAYPMPYKLDGDDPEPALLLAMARQESEFDTYAHSGAGARGLMQLLPATARNVAKQINVKYSRSKLKSDPHYNLKLGRAYLSGLLKSYDGSYVLALAAYNAGPARVRRWIKEFGDPRDPQVDAIDWIEMIPISETRNYVQRVLEGLQVYRLRLGTMTVAMSLENDLHMRE